MDASAAPSSPRRRSRLSRPTHAEALATQLAEAIVGGERPPGTALEELQLAAEFGVSRTPVREALRQLAATGLVEHRPRRGAVVARPDTARLHGMFQVMAELEAMVATLCASAMPPRERRALEVLHSSMAEMVRFSRLAEYRAANVEFHRRLYAGSGNAYLAELAGATRQRLAPFRGAQLEAPERLRRSHAEHGEILTAIARGDGATAAAAARLHLRLTEEAWALMASI
ncbi:GntR family transcriptional regulator [Plastoroseomonas hellenica]|uniref:GntR family transcriptional regulator n=1 Tax=Plastoroseomonas hellenica TaxID=2687306 RepID=UPI001BABDC2C|nr:GntR family transcriptional regulator [Plastoroseomonas hellenica]MBR0642067.1 GntR family transcriptional regulator [Plastoroseomonas hellenica]